ncbi:hypothetical protein [Marinomonas sp. MED121]|uniref:hypothetical protein n=1 Tax=Marinomonas sp. MED121 TaxID=314277 RepID=UPI001038F2AF|nr:hypothetical protein [Marinomonas sp. MED121]
MYSLKTTRLSTSLYDSVPWLCFCWGLVLTAHIKLVPELYNELSLALAILASLFTLFRRYYASEKGRISIVNNQARFETANACYQVEFEGFNGWRLLARVSLDADTGMAASSWRTVTLHSVLKKVKQVFTSPSFLSIYHTSLASEDYAYLRSFAAYQCQMSKLKQKYEGPKAKKK